MSLGIWVGGGGEGGGLGGGGGVLPPLLPHSEFYPRAHLRVGGDGCTSSLKTMGGIFLSDIR